MHNLELTPVEYRVLMHALGVADSALGDLKDTESQSRLKGLIGKISNAVDPAVRKQAEEAQASSEAQATAEAQAAMQPASAAGLGVAKQPPEAKQPEPAKKK